MVAAAGLPPVVTAMVAPVHPVQAGLGVPKEQIVRVEPSLEVERGVVSLLPADAVRGDEQPKAIAPLRAHASHCLVSFGGVRRRVLVTERGKVVSDRSGPDGIVVFRAIDLDDVPVDEQLPPRPDINRHRFRRRCHRRGNRHEAAGTRAVRGEARYGQGREPGRDS